MAFAALLSTLALALLAVYAAPSVHSHGYDARSTLSLHDHEFQKQSVIDANIAAVKTPQKTLIQRPIPNEVSQTLAFSLNISNNIKIGLHACKIIIKKYFCLFFPCSHAQLAQLQTIISLKRILTSVEILWQVGLNWVDNGR